METVFNEFFMEKMKLISIRVFDGNLICFDNKMVLIPAYRYEQENNTFLKSRILRSTSYFIGQSSSSLH